MDAKKLRSFLIRCTTLLPSPYSAEDANRVTLAYFALASLKLSGSLASALRAEERSAVADWAYSLQQPTGGFVGSRAAGQRSSAHVINTYTALCCLVLLDDDLSRVDKPALTRFLQDCQRTTGAFESQTGSGETDLRVLYAAFAVCRILNIWDGINVAQALDYLWSCQRYDGSFGQVPFAESHSGSTYCALATLELAGCLQASARRLDDTLRWLVQRQQGAESIDNAEFAGGGIQGRPHKDADACYCFWVGASIALLTGALIPLNASQMAHFIAACQHRVIGGFASQPAGLPDLYHTYLSLAALSLTGTAKELLALDCALNLPKDCTLQVANVIQA